MSEQQNPKKRLAILGAGPSGLFVYKHIVESGRTDFTVDIFESKSQLGSGMPYSMAGANVEHITNVSCNEIPQLVTTVHEWLKTLPASSLDRFGMSVDTFNADKVLPRLLFGEYLDNQFHLLQQRANENGITTTVYYDTRVTDLIDQPHNGTVRVEIAGAVEREFDYVVICTGHLWPVKSEGLVPGYFDSPYPPSKLQGHHDHSVALRGSSLTAVDAIRTLARSNGAFTRSDTKKLDYHTNDDAQDFRIVMHSRNGILPCVRFHTDSQQLGTGSVLSREDVAANMASNDGFLSLDFLFDRNFKEPLREKDPEFYERIKGMTIEQFVAAMLDMREGIDAFSFFKGEYAEAEKSIRRRESIYWKEMLSNLSFAMNYPAKHMSAEDMYRHQHTLMPLISIVIAFVPQSSCEELIALHDAGRLDLISVGADSSVQQNPLGGASFCYQDDSGTTVQTEYQTFVDCIGQPHLSLDAFPFRSLVENGSVVPARLRFRSNAEGIRLKATGDDHVEQGPSGDYFLRVPGMAITDNFQVIDDNGVANPRVFMMAVPFIGGYNPDYSGLDFCEEAGGLVVDTIMRGSR